MRWPFMTTCRVPRDLAAVTTTRTDAEVDPRSVGRVARRRGRRLARRGAAVRERHSPGHPALRAPPRRGAHRPRHRPRGRQRPERPADAKKVLADADTPFNIFSASKAVTAMLIHLLDQRASAPPRRPGVRVHPGVRRPRQGTDHHPARAHPSRRHPQPAARGDAAGEPRRTRDISRSCCATPSRTSRAGPAARLPRHHRRLHARRGRPPRHRHSSIRTLLAQEIRDPLGFRWMNYGVAPRDVQHVRASTTSPARRRCRRCRR